LTRAKSHPAKTSANFEHPGDFFDVTAEIDRQRSRRTRPAGDAPAVQPHAVGRRDRYFGRPRITGQNFLPVGRIERLGEVNQILASRHQRHQNAPDDQRDRRRYRERATHEGDGVREPTIAAV
jgi:hypothetical protein